MSPSSNASDGSSVVDFASELPEGFTNDGDKSRSEWSTYLFCQSASLIVAPFASDLETDATETAASTRDNTAATTGDEDGTSTSAP
jgi:hypothetical protein